MLLEKTNHKISMYKLLVIELRFCCIPPPFSNKTALMSGCCFELHSALGQRRFSVQSTALCILATSQQVELTSQDETCMLPFSQNQSKNHLAWFWPATIYF